MNWEQTIEYIRKLPEYKQLVVHAYFDENLPLNIERFRESEEYRETIKLINFYAPDAKTILDVGCGNGISSIAFALDGYTVTASEPDASDTVGAGAVKWLKEYYNLNNIEVYQEFAEKINLTKGAFDIVYVRQAMHHAYHLNDFINNLTTLIKPAGYLITVRDHVVSDEADKERFLENHPLHKFYGGENAFKVEEYIAAMEKAGLTIQKIYKHFETVINYAPVTAAELKEKEIENELNIQKGLVEKIGFLGKIPWVMNLYKRKIGFNKMNIFDEKDIPGRMYSFIAQKK
jgi:SAM-dependent methyltransferase